MGPFGGGVLGQRLFGWRDGARSPLQDYVARPVRFIRLWGWRVMGEERRGWNGSGWLGGRGSGGGVDLEGGWD